MSTREVELTGGAPWGFRMHGGADQNQPLRISRVNPGRKASLSGIREGDVITSINGRATKDMSNADAHAMLRSAGPALRLGLNEDREMSPRRRSIGKAAELKRPSQLISEISSGKATPQAPVYATIRPSHLPQNKLQSPTRSLNSLQSSFNSTPLVKSVVSSEEPPKFHPTNPFYSTLPMNYNTSKLPIPNGKVSNSPLHSRSVTKIDPFSENNNEHDLKFSSFFLKKIDSGPSSIPNIMCDDSQPNNLHTSPKYFTNDKYNTFSNSQREPLGFKVMDDGKSNDRNPFESNRTNNCHQYKQSNDKLNGSSPKGEKTLLYSKSDGDFQTNEKVIKHSTITEKKISEVEEIKTIKKIILNGSNESDHNHKNGILNSSEDLSKYSNKQNRSLSQDHVIKEHLIPTTIEDDNFYKNETERRRTKQEYHRSPSSQSAREEYNVGK